MNWENFPHKILRETITVALGARGHHESNWTLQAVKISNPEKHTHKEEVHKIQCDPTTQIYAPELDRSFNAELTASRSFRIAKVA